MSENSTSDLGAFLAGFVIGGLVGAATAIILAPQSGQETRAQIASKSEDIIHAGGEQYHHYRDAAGNYASDYVTKAGEVVSQTKEQMGATTNRVQEQARIVLDRGKESPASENGGDAPEESADSNDIATE